MWSASDWVAHPCSSRTNLLIFDFQKSIFLKICDFQESIFLKFQKQLEDVLYCDFVRPSNSREERRISTGGLHVEEGRILGDLAVSRALGDFQFKQCAQVPHSQGLNSHAQTCGFSATGLNPGLKINKKKKKKSFYLKR